jgi:CheY-like chemotaxis protein
VTVLVVDEDPCSRALLAAALPALGFDVLTASSGAEAAQMVDERRDIHVVLLDMDLEKGLDGPQTLAALRKTAPDLRCCLMTGLVGRYLDDYFLVLGGLQVVLKPFDDLQELRRAIREAAGLTNGPT